MRRNRPGCGIARGAGIACSREVTAATAVLALGLLGQAEASAVDLEAAQRQFLISCGVCHTVKSGEAHRQGPNLYGVYGRDAGALTDFAYSPALKGGRWMWDETTLDPWLANAQDAHPGSTMAYRQSDPDKRALIIGLLRSRSAGGPEDPKP
jgi:cytochrome c